MIGPLCTLKASKKFYFIAKKHQETTKLWGTSSWLVRPVLRRKGRKGRRQKIRGNWEKKMAEAKASDRMGWA